MNGYVPVAVTRRSGFHESVHWGAAVAIGADGTILWSVGDPELLVYPRSSTKPLLATGMVEAGLAVTPEQLALVCSSHDGSPAHIE
ncbi:MAG: asparaginase, partial [Ilumatobacteraceae bacterium]|nr:asparaginase [Ilumatobacteraceae bacterium]